MTLTLCCCYCGTLALLGVFFFGLILALSFTENEYLARNFYRDGEDRKSAVGIVIVINAVITIMCRIAINRQMDKGRGVERWTAPRMQE